MAPLHMQDLAYEEVLTGETTGLVNDQYLLRAR